MSPDGPRGGAGAPDVEAEIDALYGLPLGEFTAARNALAARLRAAGLADAAGAVKARAKPGLAAWAVNQLARRHRAEMDALFAAGDALRDAQARAMAGGGGDALGVALASQRSVLARLGLAAEKLLGDAGHGTGAGTLDRVAASLRALANDPEARARFGAGRLAEDLEPPGFGALVALEGHEPAAGAPAPAPAPAGRAPAAAGARTPAAGARAPAAGGRPPGEPAAAPAGASSAHPAIAARIAEVAEERRRAAAAAEALAEALAALKDRREKLVAAERRVTETRHAAEQATRAAKEARSEVALAEERVEKARKSKTGE
jgi:hypothetical protein